MRLAIGTVQFGLPYGISNEGGQTSKLEAKKILDMASKNGIDTLDTAPAYGNSEATLGEVGVGGWNVISKVPPMPVGSVHSSNRVLRYIKASLFNLKIDQISGVLLHAPEQLLNSNGPEIIHGLERAKLLGLVKKVGYSIYSPEHLSSLL